MLSFPKINYIELILQINGAAQFNLLVLLPVLKSVHPQMYCRVLKCINSQNSFFNNEF